MSGKRNDGPGGETSCSDFYRRSSVYGELAQEHRSSGSLGLNQIRVEQPAIDQTDPAWPVYVFTRRDDSADVAIDYGDGARRSRRSTVGAITVVPPRTEARYRVASRHRIAAMCLPEEIVGSLLERVGARTDHPFASFYANSSTFVPEASRLVDLLWQASGSVGGAANLRLDGLTLQFLSVMSVEPSLSPLADAPSDPVRVRRAVDYLETCLDTCLDTAPTLGELARVASMDEARFARAFKATTGQAVWTYVERRRRERARVLLAASGRATAPTSRSDVEDRRLIRAVEYVEAHLDTALTIGGLADVATMSRSTLARAFRRAYGMTVWSYVRNRRTARALEMLRGGTLPIAQVAERCGFASQSHLTTAVRKRYGVTPGAVRRDFASRTYLSSAPRSRLHVAGEPSRRA